MQYCLPVSCVGLGQLGELGEPTRKWEPIVGALSIEQPHQVVADLPARSSLARVFDKRRPQWGRESRIGRVLPIWPTASPCSMKITIPGGGYGVPSWPLKRDERQPSSSLRESYFALGPNPGESMATAEVGTCGHRAYLNVIVTRYAPRDLANRGVNSSR